MDGWRSGFCTVHGCVWVGWFTSPCGTTFPTNCFCCRVYAVLTACTVTCCVVEPCGLDRFFCLLRDLMVLIYLVPVDITPHYRYRIPTHFYRHWHSAFLPYPPTAVPPPPTATLPHIPRAHHLLPCAFHLPPLPHPTPCLPNCNTAATPPHRYCDYALFTAVRDAPHTAHTRLTSPTCRHAYSSVTPPITASYRCNLPCYRTLAFYLSASLPPRIRTPAATRVQLPPGLPPPHACPFCLSPYFLPCSPDTTKPIPLCYGSYDVTCCTNDALLAFG